MNNNTKKYRVFLKYSTGFNQNWRQLWNNLCAASKLRDLIYMTDQLYMNKVTNYFTSGIWQLFFNYFIMQI